MLEFALLGVVRFYDVGGGFGLALTRRAILLLILYPLLGHWWMSYQGNHQNTAQQHPGQESAPHEGPNITLRYEVYPLAEKIDGLLAMYPGVDEKVAAMLRSDFQYGLAPSDGRPSSPPVSRPRFFREWHQGEDSSSSPGAEGDRYWYMPTWDLLHKSDITERSATIQHLLFAPISTRINEYFKSQVHDEMLLQQWDSLASHSYQRILDGLQWPVWGAPDDAYAERALKTYDDVRELLSIDHRRQDSLIAPGIASAWESWSKVTELWWEVYRRERSLRRYGNGFPAAEASTFSDIGQAYRWAWAQEWLGWPSPDGLGSEPEPEPDTERGEESGERIEGRRFYDWADAPSTANATLQDWDLWAVNLTMTGLVPGEGVLLSLAADAGAFRETLQKFNAALLDMANKVSIWLAAEEILQASSRPGGGTGDDQHPGSDSLWCLLRDTITTQDPAYMRCIWDELHRIRAAIDFTVAYTADAELAAREAAAEHQKLREELAAMVRGRMTVVEELEAPPEPPVPGGGVHVAQVRQTMYGLDHLMLVGSLFIETEKRLKGPTEEEEQWFDEWLRGVMRAHMLSRLEAAQVMPQGVAQGVAHLP